MKILQIFIFCVLIVNFFFQGLRLWQEIPTTGAKKVTAFGLGGELFIFFSNSQDDATYANTNSSVFHLWNDSVRINQTFSTVAAWGADHSFIGGQLFLAITNTNSKKNNAVVYKFEGGEFKEIKTVATRRARDVHFHSIGNESFLAICDTKNGKLMNFKWQSNTFDEVHVWADLNNPYSATSFSSNGNTYLVVSGYFGVVFFKWNGTHFANKTPVSAIKNAFALHASESVEGDVFLCVINSNTDPSLVYRWDNTSSSFMKFQNFTVAKGQGCQLFNVQGYTYLAMGNQKSDAEGYNVKTDIYQFGSGSFTLYQQIATVGAEGMYAFTHSGNQYLAVSSYRNDASKYNINSQVWIWD